LIDCDILLYEIGSVCEYPKDEPIKSFDYAKEVFDRRVEEIVRRSGADSHKLFLTGTGNFRDEIATVKPYKGNRGAEKPFHYHNLKAYAISLGAEVCDGMEADDMMAIYQTADMNGSPIHDVDHDNLTADTIICTRDKDLRQVSGFHYGWECGKQPEFKRQWVTALGEIHLSDKNKLTGTGAKFFWSQVLTGDTVDNIPGLPKCGPVKAYEVLNGCESDRECYVEVGFQYADYYEEEFEVRLAEQINLCWMIRELHPEGSPVMWSR